MVWVGVTWLLGDAFQTLVLLHWGALAHLLIAYPTGRLESRVERAAVLVGYVAAVLAAVLPGNRLGARLRGSRCRPRRSYGSRPRTQPFDAVGGAARRRHRRRGRAERGRGHRAWTCSRRTSSLLASRRWLSPPTSASPNGRWRRSPAWSWTSVAARPTGSSRQRLARAIGDPSLIVGYVVEEGGPPVDRAPACRSPFPNRAARRAP